MISEYIYEKGWDFDTCSGDYVTLYCVISLGCGFVAGERRKEGARLVIVGVLCLIKKTLVSFPKASKCSDTFHVGAGEGFYDVYGYFVRSHIQQPLVP